MTEFNLLQMACNLPHKQENSSGINFMSMLSLYSVNIYIYSNQTTDLHPAACQHSFM